VYKLLNWLFGWDYVHWNGLFSSGISRVFLAKDGKVVYWKFGFPINNLEIIGEPSDVVWLTCKPDKYFKEQTNE
jgi:hypothetical protein